MRMTIFRGVSVRRSRLLIRKVYILKRFGPARRRPNGNWTSFGKREINSTKSCPSNMKL